MFRLQSLRNTIVKNNLLNNINKHSINRQLCTLNQYNNNNSNTKNTYNGYQYGSSRKGYLSSGVSFDKIMIAIAALGIGGAYFYDYELFLDENTYYNDKEFQDNFDTLLDSINDSIDKGELDKLQAQIHQPDPFLLDLEDPLEKLSLTLTNTPIGHCQPETLNNIDRTLSTLTRLSDCGLHKTSGYLNLLACLNELLDDCGDIGRFVPKIFALAQHDNITPLSLLIIIKPVLVIARDKKNRKFLVDNHAIPAFKRIIDRVYAERIGRENYFLNEVLYTLYDIVNSVDENTLSTDIDLEERNLISNYRQAPGSFWANRWNIHMAYWVPAFLFSIPAYSLPLAVSMPSIAGFGVIYTLMNALEVYDTGSIGTRLKSDKFNIKALTTTCSHYLPILAILGVIKYPVLLKPVLGYSVGHYFSRNQLMANTPYQDPLYRFNQ
ncbi:hypothetical protein CYY_004095 [Polysphondylium violaceum]|uniref:Uncharacterized protein n=1 Tax=Polysphondylium violaceum TaxID=133409 RepID=A0A8J4PV43_9MYCE|nr:hypothetical protein CYY_004095 [Polysphondylium violaceum]